MMIIINGKAQTMIACLSLVWGRVRRESKKCVTHLCCCTARAWVHDCVLCSIAYHHNAATLYHSAASIIVLLSYASSTKVVALQYYSLQCAT